MKYLRRLQTELRLFAKRDPLTNIVMKPSEDNLLLWYFAIHGLENQHKNGIYLGKLIIGTEYPFRQPEIVMLTPNGRFDTLQPICVRTEDWSPRWNLQTLLVSFLELFLEEPILVTHDVANSQDYNRIHYPEILDQLGI